jgi:DNA-binding FadR family transcriptional regulator
MALKEKHTMGNMQHPETTERNTMDPVELRLTDLLSRSEMRPGTRLPTERALAEDLQVSRSAVRRAMARLEAQGKVVRVIGSGTYVADTSAPGDPDITVLEHEDYSPREIMDARMLLEPRFASLIVIHANKADIEAIRKTLLEAERATDFATFEHWDGQFHQMLAEATHNRLIIDLFRIVTQSRDTAAWGDLKKGSITAERREIYCQEHARIFEALQARNARLAEKAIETHLVTVRQNLLGA